MMVTDIGSAEEDTAISRTHKKSLKNILGLVRISSTHIKHWLLVK